MGDATAAQRDWETDERLARRQRTLGFGCGLTSCAGGVVVLLLAGSLAAGLRSCELSLGTPTCTGSELLEAAEAGDLERVRGLVDPATVDDVHAGDTALGCAVASGDTDVVTAVLDAGADPDLAGANGDRPLAQAVEAGREEIVPLLLDAGADPDGAIARRPVALATSDGQVEMVELLLDAGADPNGAVDGTPALLAAVESDASSALVRLLLEAGADPDRTGPRTRTGFILGEGAHSPLLQATFAGRHDLMAMLLAAGADPDHGGELTFSEVSLTTLNVLDSAGVAVGSPEADGVLYPSSRLTADAVDDVPPLVVAAMRSDAEAADLLLGAGADARLAAFDAYTPLYAAAWLGDEALVRTLLDAGADPEPLPSNMKETPLGAATVRGHAPVVAALTAAGATR